MKHVTHQPYPRLADRLRHFNAGEAEKLDYVRYCRTIADQAGHLKPLSFEQWRKSKLNTGNREGQNHD